MKVILKSNFFVLCFIAGYVFSGWELTQDQTKFIESALIGMPSKVTYQTVPSDENERLVLFTYGEKICVADIAKGDLFNLIRILSYNFFNIRIKLE